MAYARSHYRRPPYQSFGGPPTRAKLWVKGIKSVLSKHREPVHLGKLLNEFRDWVVNNNVTDPDHPDRLLNTFDQDYLDWMAKKAIINEYKFNNRPGEKYYGYGVSVTYDNMNDTPVTVDWLDAKGSPKKTPKYQDEDREVVESHPEPKLSAMVAMTEQIMILETQVKDLLNRVANLEEQTGVQPKPAKTPRKKQ